MQSDMKWLKLGVGVLSAGFILAACGNGEETADNGDTADDGDTDQQVDTGDAVEITFWHAMNGPHQEAITELTERFNESQDEYVVIEQGQGSYNDLRQSFTAAAVSGDLPTMTQLTPTDVPELASNDLLVPLTDDFLTSNGFSQETLDDIFEGFLESSVFDGEMYALPFSKSTRVMYYNQDILDEYGVELPQTWDEVIELGDLMQEAGDDAYAMGLENGFEMEWETLARQNGAEFYNPETNTVDLNGPEAVEALEFIDMMLSDGYARTAGEDDYFSGPFGQGAAALYIGSSAGISHTEPVAEEITWSTAPTPAWDGVELTLFAGNDLGLFSTASEEEQEAFVAYLEFLLQPEHTAEWAMATGYLPIRESALEDPDYVAFLEENPHYEAASTMLDYGMSSPTFVGYGEFRNAMLDAMDDVAISGMEPQDVLDNLQVETETILESNE